MAREIKTRQAAEATAVLYVDARACDDAGVDASPSASTVAGPRSYYDPGTLKTDYPILSATYPLDLQKKKNSLKTKLSLNLS